MYVYFIRHGETTFNKRAVHQPLDAPLSERGVAQARAVGDALAECKIDAIFSSDLKRSVSTANIMAEALERPVTTTRLFREIRRPRSLHERFYLHPQTFDYVLRTIANRNNPAWHYEDSESLFEVHHRARDADDYLAGLHGTYKAIAVVTHAIFLELFVKFTCKRGKTSMLEYFPIFSPFSTIDNGSLTVMERFDTAAENVCAWRLECFNETGHLNA